MWKLWTILFFGKSNHLLEKITYRIHFLMQFSRFFRKNCLTRLSLLTRTIPLLRLVFQFHLRAIINDLVFLLILKLLLLNNFLKSEDQVVVFWIFFLRLSTQFFNTIFLKFEVHSAKKFYKWRSKSSKIAG